MKKIFIAIAVSLAVISCKQEAKEVKTEAEVTDASQYESFGAEISPEGAISSEEMLKKYDEMAVGDSVQIAFKGKVNSVCQAKGCWMKLDLGQPEKESFVKFKDYKFFVPMDAAQADAVIKGWAYKSETSVDELKHYAKDAGKSDEEIAAITAPKTEYTFMADGVLLKKKG
ncbi:DUF4920 domain-containing protein [Moheibacter sediminis]|uniref:DUF4920 domain-containing protein n=1 Tax=Moheibacter sediminis TaxID=1434700 RepID=A0A1W2D1P7_9FLAO|nr:DUF4920 domain-containing protein [Moheibacter sediminis]SMC91421.1 protein of unknown function [Moheibacter sediminis]